MCRKCSYSLETAEHVLLKCKKMPIKDPLLSLRLIQERQKHDTFKEFLSTNSSDLEKLLIHCEKFVVIATRKENGEDVEDDERV